MKQLLAAITITAVLALPTTANAAWVHDAAGNTIQPYAAWAAASLMPAPNANVLIHTDDTACNGQSFACSSYDEIWITNTDPEHYVPNRKLLRRAFLHELGHVLDASPATTDADRSEFMRLRYLYGPWHTGDRASPDEQFAEAYSICAVYGPNAPHGMDAVGNQIFGRSGYKPSPARHRKVCSLLKSIAANQA